MKKILVLTFLISLQSIACEFDAPRALNLFTSLNKEQTHAFDVDRTLHDAPFFRAFNCKKLALRNKYIMIGLGPEINEYDDQVRSYSFNDDIRPSMCTIKNSPFKLVPFEEKLKIFKQKKKYFNECVEVYIEDEGRLPLKITEDQPGCKVKKITKHKAVFQGGYCFVKPNITSSYLVKVKIKKECQTKSGFKKLGLDPSDLKGIINYYAAADETGTSTDLEALESTPVRLITNSDENVILSSESYGEINPQFPAQWVNPNTFLGKVTLKDTGGKRYLISTPLLVDNRCKKVCKEGLCYGPCKYAQPVVVEARLYEKGKRKYEYLTGWYDGGVAAPDYQGFIRGIGFEIPTRLLNENKIYKLDLNFNDPKFDFEKLKNRLVRKFGRIEQQLPQMGRSSMSDIPDINEILSLTALPEIRQILGINFDKGLDGLKNAIDLLRSYIGYKLWPPYYEENCSADLKTCSSANSDKTKIILKFKIKKLNNEVKMEVLSVERKSKLLAPFKDNKLPYIECGYDI